jgi:hypothetical protein
VACTKTGKAVNNRSKKRERKEEQIKRTVNIVVTRRLLQHSIAIPIPEELYDNGMHSNLGGFYLKEIYKPKID